jgi:2,5-dihydroxypyridine 5,6-dioxygenase
MYYGLEPPTMLTTDPIEPVWLEAFDTVLRRCVLRPGDTVAVPAESQRRPALVQHAQLAAARQGCKPFHLIVTSPFEPGRPVISALAPSKLVVDCTVKHDGVTVVDNRTVAA